MDTVPTRNMPLVLRFHQIAQHYTLPSPSPNITARAGAAITESCRIMRMIWPSGIPIGGGGHRNETRRNAAEFSNPETDYDVDLFPETGTSPI